MAAGDDSDSDEMQSVVSSDEEARPHGVDESDSEEGKSCVCLGAF